MANRDTLVFDVRLLSRKTAIAGFLRGELAKKAGLSDNPIARAFGGRPIGVRSARQIARALGVPLRDLVSPKDESRRE